MRDGLERKILTRGYEISELEESLQEYEDLGVIMVSKNRKQITLV